MTQLRGALRRELSKFERPKTLFGKKTYLEEQATVSSAYSDVVKGGVAYSPNITKVDVPFYLPKKQRINRVKFYFNRVKNKLNEIVP